MEWATLGELVFGNKGYVFTLRNIWEGNYFRNYGLYDLRLNYKSIRKIKEMKLTKPIKQDKNSKYYHLKQIAQMTLGSGNMNLAV